MPAFVIALLFLLGAFSRAEAAEHDHHAMAAPASFLRGFWLWQSTYFRSHFYQPTN